MFFKQTENKFIIAYSLLITFGNYFFVRKTPGVTD